jgi:hypothetical protein
MEKSIVCSRFGVVFFGAVLVFFSTFSPLPVPAVEGDWPPAPIVFSPGEREELRGSGSVEFSWLAEPAAERYQLILSRDRLFRRTVAGSAGISGTSFAVDGLNFGTYFFRIRSIGPGGERDPFSVTFSFIIVPPPPTRVILPTDNNP